jgi:predicted RNase H-like HicB family nuclease
VNIYDCTDAGGRATQEQLPTTTLLIIGICCMEQIINLHIEKLPEGVYLATSEDISGLIAQGRTITETLEIARDVAKKLLEAQTERHLLSNLKQTEDSFDYPLVVSS